MRPIGLSSRTISPVSVTHDVVVRLLNVMRTLNAGIGRRLPMVTTSRAPTSIFTGAFFIVAGSNTIHSFVAPAVKPSLASLRPTLNISAGDSASSRVSDRVPEVPVMSSNSFRPFSRPLIDIGPVPGSSEKLKDCSWNERSTRAVVLRIAAVVAPSNENCNRPSSCSSKPSSVA